MQIEKTKKTIAVLMGGTSSERPVSLSSGNAAVQALTDAGYHVTTIDVSDDIHGLTQSLLNSRPDAVFIALHGPGGEDGKIQGLLDLLQIPYTHSGVLASALAMDKAAARHIFIADGIRCADGKVVDVEELKQHDPMPRPYVVKPISEGSSFGVQIIHDGNNKGFDSDSWHFGNKALVEKYIPGRELTVAVMGDRALGVIEIVSKTSFYDYQAKYTTQQSEHILPAPIPAPVYQQAMDMAVKAHQALGCRGISRSDFRYDDTSDQAAGLYILEVNTVPGMTPTSLVPEMAAYQGISFQQLVSWMVENAQCDK